jgi:two-component system chemotaxis response regulator CheB
MPSRDLVVIGASAGGLDALLKLIVELPRDFRPAIIVVIHTGPDGSGYLRQILARRSPVPVEVAQHGAAIKPGRIYVAPPDFHVLVSDHRLQLGRGPKENGFRPAVDPLFRSASRARGKAVIGVVLSGGLDDGTYGLQTIKDNGGVTVAQDPDEAIVPGMPQSAIRNVDPDHVLGAAAIGRLLVTLSSAPVKAGVAMAKRDDPEPQALAGPTEVVDMQQMYGPPTGLTCPDCGGALWEIKDKQLFRYRCHVGHQYLSEGLDGLQHEVVETALWSAVRVLEEHAEMRRRMARRAGEAGLQTVSEGFDHSALEAHRQASEIRALLFARRTPEPTGAAETKSIAARAKRRAIRKKPTARKRARARSAN